MAIDIRTYATRCYVSDNPRRTDHGTDGQRTDDDGTDGQRTNDDDDFETDDGTDGRTENDDGDDETDTTGRMDRGRRTTTGWTDHDVQPEGCFSDVPPDECYTT